MLLLTPSFHPDTSCFHQGRIFRDMNHTNYTDTFGYSLLQFSGNQQKKQNKVNISFAHMNSQYAIFLFNTSFAHMNSQYFQNLRILNQVKKINNILRTFTMLAKQNMRTHKKITEITLFMI